MRMISRCYVELVLNIPPVVFIFIFYFFLSGQLMPLIGIDDIDRNGAFVSSSFFTRCLVIHDYFQILWRGPYVLRCLKVPTYRNCASRHSILTKGQWEAARAVGLSPLNVLRDIIFPQAIRKILPPLPVNSLPSLRLSDCLADLHSRAYLPNRGCINHDQSF